MIKLAIRDDDLNFFSKVEDVVEMYKPLGHFPISFAIVPCVKDCNPEGLCPETKGNTVPSFIGENKELVAWLREGLRKGSLDVLMHGITHEYHFTPKGEKIAEMIWRKEPDLADIIGSFKSQLENQLDCKITVFVAPSNKISKYGLKCVVNNGMDFSGIVPITFNRDFTLINLSNYIRRWYYRIKDRLPYPNVLQYSDHKELNACTLQGYDYLVKMFKYCIKIESPMVINVHYWHLRENPEERKMLFSFIEYALNCGAVPATLSSLLKDLY